MAICSADVPALRVVEFLVAGVDFLLRGGNQRIEQIVSLDAETFAAGDLNVRLSRDLLRFTS